MPDTPDTYAHPKCYARTLGGCSTKITKEHFVSQSILKTMGPQLRVQGLPWIVGKSYVEVSETALQSKALCKVHNTLLTELDAEALNLVKHIRTAVETLRWRTGRSNFRILSVNGHKIERWLLKVLYGMVAAGNVSVGPDKVALESKPPFLAALFGMASLPSSCGLYLGIPRETIDLFDGRISVASLSMMMSGVAHPSGIVLRLQGLVLILALYAPPHDILDRERLSRVVYRPGGHRFHREKSVIEINLGWNEPWVGETVSSVIVE